jgi:DNA-binding transcriptional LysR family regulator
MHAAVLRYFQEVARRGSVRRAAAVLNVASSAVNRQLLKLEAELGVPLFDRLPGGMRLTRAGELLLRHVGDTLHDFERVHADIDDLRGVKTGHVSVVAVDSLLVDFLPKALEEFRAEFPAVTYSVLAVAPAAVSGEIVAGRADIGFSFLARPEPGTQYFAAIGAPIGVIMAAGHPLARRKRVTFDECRRFPIVLQEGPLPRASEIDPDFAAFRESLAPKLVSNSISLLKQAIRQGMGISFFTRLGFMHEISEGEVVWRPFASRPINTLKLGMVTPTERRVPMVTTMMIDHLAKRLREIGDAA